MEWFKVAQGSWNYPEASLLRVFDVPLFTGFMYASVGSYIARIIRLSDLRFEGMPVSWMTAFFALLVYANFITHHYIWDMRWALFGLSLLLFWRASVGREVMWPLLAVFLLGAGAMYIAENIGTLSGTWIYAGQARWELVRFAKFGSWYLLLFVSFALVYLPLRRAGEA